MKETVTRNSYVIDFTTSNHKDLAITIIAKSVNSAIELLRSDYKRPIKINSVIFTGECEVGIGSILLRD